MSKHHQSILQQITERAAGRAVVGSMSSYSPVVRLELPGQMLVTVRVGSALEWVDQHMNYLPGQTLTVQFG